MIIKVEGSLSRGIIKHLNKVYNRSIGLCNKLVILFMNSVLQCYFSVMGCATY